IQERYKIKQEIGRGGFSVVYRAEDLILGSEVALKVVLPPPADSSKVFARLQREARILRELNHPNIVKAHDVVVEENRALMV
ncbi:UNVERIFIED_CONTAM: hypothetical protein GTU68_004264, partial [Idotea baltica]|nr:hypothetical protein [Idotea baltica]